MAKEIIWPAQAIADRMNILAYWIERNQSNAYSFRLDLLFRDAVLLISAYPFIGKPTDIRDVRAKRVRDYYIMYSETEDQIQILSIWDTRQKPGKLKKKLKK